MKIEEGVPTWVARDVRAWLARLGVEDYITTVETMETILNEEDEEYDAQETYAQARVQARYLRALLVFKASLENDAYGRHVVAHECGHILLGEVAAVVQHLIDMLPQEVKPLAHEMWDDASDRTIERLTRAYEDQLLLLAPPTQTTQSDTVPEDSPWNHSRLNE